LSENITNLLYLLEDSALGNWVATSLWGYPIFLTLHTIGMATLVGLSLMYAANVLLTSKNDALVNLAVYWKLALFGLILNLVSGSALFISSASSMWLSWPFRIKLILIALGLLLSISLVKSCVSSSAHYRQRLKALAVIVIWLLALVAGRLIAYIE